MFKFLFLVMAYTCLVSQTNDKIFPFGIIKTIDSHILKETRTLNIYLPQGYHPDSLSTYPAIYLLDGSAHEDFPHIAGLVQFMNMYDLLPKSIVIGIANVDRYRDFTSVSTDSADRNQLPTSGGSEQFIRFIETELQPFVQQTFKTNGSQTIIGQSLGGLLATEILLKKPELFNDFIIVSPSLWWNKHALVNQASDLFLKGSKQTPRVFLSIGTEHPEMHAVADKLAEAIRHPKNKKITFYYNPLPNETHATVLHRAVYNAFETLHSKTVTHAKH